MFVSSDQRTYLRMLAELILLALAVFVLGALLVHAQTTRTTAPGDVGISTTTDEEPLMRDYKGVRINMTSAEARRLLGEPTDKSDAEDVYNFSDNEAAQIYYDASRRVAAVTVHYFGDSGPPTTRDLFGMDVEPRADGSVYKLIKYRRAGYWVSYSRTAGPAPVVTISMKRDTDE